MTAPPNPHEALARERKATALLPVCIRAGMSAAEAETATEAQRKLAAWAAGVKPPSDETWARVVEGLRRYEATKGEDPFEGLCS